jgi:WD40 repeat protein
VARLQHPNIVQIYEVGEQDGCPYFSLEYVDGGSLSRRLDGNPLPDRLAAELVETLARAVHYAHLCGIIHRDLKPANVLLAFSREPRASADPALARGSRLNDGVPKITDFGLAKRLEAAEGPTRTGDVMGTPSYMAPEQAGGVTRKIGPAADVYSLGAILYELLTGRPPFRAASPMETVLQVLKEDPVPLSRLRHKAPRDLDTICRKCLQKEPHKRYASAEALAEDLRRFLQGEPIRACRVSAWEKTWSWIKRRPALAGLVAAVAVAVLALVGIVFAASYNAALQRSNTRLEAARAETEAALYFNRIVLAEREWSSNNVQRVQELLDDCPVDRRGWEWHYLHRLCHTFLQVLRGHTHEVHAVAFHPGGRLIASASVDQTVKIWDVSTGRVVHNLGGHAGWVRGLAFSPDGQRLASSTGTPAGYPMAGAPSEIKIWDVKTGQLLRTLHGHDGPIPRVSIHRNNRWLASAGADGKVIVWDIDTGKRVRVMAGYRDGVDALVFHPDGQWLAAAGTGEAGQPEVALWDVKSGQRLRTFIGHAAGMNDVSFTPDGRRLASASDDETIKVWDPATGHEVQTLRGHSHFVLCVRFFPDNRRLASCGEDGTIKIWDLTRSQPPITLRGHAGGGVNGLAVRPDGLWLASCGDDRTIRLWDPKATQEALSLGGHERRARAVAFNPDSRFLASGSDDHSVKVWDLVRGRSMLTFHRHALPVRSVAWSPDGRLVASAGGRRESQPGELMIWRATTGRLRFRLGGHDGPITSVAFSPDGKSLASVSSDRTVKLWNVADGKVRFTLRGHIGPVAGLAWDPRGKQLASTSYDFTVRLWDSTTGQCTHTNRGDTYYVAGLAFHPQGRRLALARGDGTLHILDTDTWQRVLTLRRHLHNVVGVAFSPDGRRIASISEDKTLKLWDAETGQEILTLRNVAGWEAYNAIAWSPDGQRIAAPGPNGVVKVWNATPLARGE